MTDLRYQKQKFRHKPDEGIFGDCARTVLACLLELPRDDVPHFYEVENDPDFHAKMDRWLADRGLDRISIVFNGDQTVEEVLRSVSFLNPCLRFQLMGTSKTGCNHVVICKDGKIDHDPSINNSGIVGPCNDGFYWIEFLTPIQFTK